MATLSITKDWADGEVLLEADLDNIKEDVETFLNTTQLNDDNLQNAGITASTKLIDGSIPTAKIANLSVTTAKIDDLSITTGKIAANAITTAKITDANITKAKLAPAARDATASAKSADDTLDLTEDLVTVDSSGALRTITLPPASTSSGHEYTITKTSGSNTVVIDANSSELINGATTLTLYEQYETVTIWCDGSGWYIRNRYIPGNTFQPVVVRAKRTASLSLTDSADSTIGFDSEDVDNKSAYNSSTGVFTCPTGCDGQYLIGASIRFDGASGFWETNEGGYLKYQKNAETSVVLGVDMANTSNGADRTAAGSDVVDLVATDTIKFLAYQDSDASAGLVSSSTENHCFIVRIR